MRLTCLFLILTFDCFAQQSVGLMHSSVDASEGYVLFSNNTTTYLIDNCGLVVNTWESEYKPGESVYLLNDGDLLRTAEVNGFYNVGGAGGRIERYSWDGVLEWSHNFASKTEHAHHDIEPLPNGNILMILADRKYEDEAKAAGRIANGEVWSEKIVEVRMVGTDDAEIVWEWNLWDHLIQDASSMSAGFGVISDHPELVNINYTGDGTHKNWIHLNSIDYHPGLNQIAVSSRLFSEIWIIDHSTSMAEASSHTGGEMGRGGDLLYRYGNPQTYERGGANNRLFYNQHDVRWVPPGYPNEGMMMVFNNNPNGNSSSINLWEPPVDANGHYAPGNIAFGPQSIEWSYTSDDFHSTYMSSAHMMPNGNLFVCEGMKGRFFEVTLGQETVWEYINPVNANGGPAVQGGTPRFNETFHATKYAFDYPAFNGKNMMGHHPVELNPWESICYIPDSSGSVDQPTIRLLGNMVTQIMTIRSLAPYTVWASVYDLQGSIKGTYSIHEGDNVIDLGLFDCGMYFMSFQVDNSKRQIDRFVISRL